MSNTKSAGRLYVITVPSNSPSIPVTWSEITTAPLASAS